jgi:exopolysaccharide production protein ExoZ
VDPNTAFRAGAAGVDLFFVISGFIMATVGRDRTPGKFLRDRIWRIYPLWWIAVAPWLIAKNHDLPTVLTSLTLWPIWSGSFHTPALLIGWTLCFEMLFYVAFAVGLATRAAFPLVCFALCLAMAARNDLFAYFGSPLILEFIAGACIAQLRPSPGWGVLIGIGFVWLAVAPVDHYTAVFGSHGFQRLFAWGVPAAMIVYGARSIERAFDHPCFDAAVLIGNASYSIYVFHLLIVGNVPWPIGVVGAVAFGIVSYLFLERSILRMKPRWPLMAGDTLAGRSGNIAARRGAPAE